MTNNITFDARTEGFKSILYVHIIGPGVVSMSVWPIINIIIMSVCVRACIRHGRAPETFGC